MVRTVDQRAAGEVWQGGQITRAGVYSNMPLRHYHGAEVCDGPSVSSSGLRTLFTESPAHYWCDSPYNEERVHREKSRAFVFGAAAHHILLGQAAFSREFARAPRKVQRVDGEWVDWSLQTNEAKAIRDAVKRQGLELLYPDEADRIEALGKALAVHPIVRSGALGGYVERSAFWRDKATGFWLKIRPDVIPTASGDFVDFKTAASVQWADLQRAIHEHGYDMQMAMMRMGFRALKIEFASCSLVFIEKEPPHCVRIVTLSDGDLDRGERKVREALRSFDRCWRSGQWPGPGGVRRDAEVIHMPEWAVKADEGRLTAYGEDNQAA